MLSSGTLAIVGKMDSIELKTLKEMHHKAALLMLRDPVYLPIFQRIERELAAFEIQGDAPRPRHCRPSQAGGLKYFLQMIQRGTLAIPLPVQRVAHQVAPHPLIYTRRKLPILEAVPQPIHGMLRRL